MKYCSLTLLLTALVAGASIRDSGKTNPEKFDNINTSGTKTPQSIPDSKVKFDRPDDQSGQLDTLKESLNASGINDEEAKPKSKTKRNKSQVKATSMFNENQKEFESNELGEESEGRGISEQPRRGRSNSEASLTNSGSQTTRDKTDSKVEARQVDEKMSAEERENLTLLMLSPYLGA